MSLPPSDGVMKPWPLEREKHLHTPVNTGPCDARAVLHRGTHIEVEDERAETKKVSDEKRATMSAYQQNTPKIIHPLPKSSAFRYYDPVKHLQAYHSKQDII